MSRLLFPFLAAAVQAWASPAGAETAFFAAIDDVPLPPGFHEQGEGFAFNGPDGRIIEAEAVGDGDPLAVQTFYQQTLPALGWSEAPAAAEGLVFLRGRERLVLQLGPAALRLRLTVRPASMQPD